MKKVILLLIFSVLGGLTSCVTIQSNIKTDAMPSNFRRVLVVTKMRNAPDSYVRQFARLFPAGYEVCTLALSPLSFDNPDEAIRKQVESCHSEVVLTVELVSAGRTGSRYSRNVSYEYNAEMQSVASGQAFWKAVISSNPENGEQVPPGSIIKRLLQDRIIEGKAAPGNVAQTMN